MLTTGSDPGSVRLGLGLGFGLGPGRTRRGVGQTYVFERFDPTLRVLVSYSSSSPRMSVSGFGLGLGN